MRWRTVRILQKPALPPHPRWRQLHDLPMDRAGLVVGARQVDGDHEEFADDLAAHELEGLAEQLHPLVLAERMVRVDPAAEGARSEEHTSAIQSLIRHSYALIYLI